MKGDKFDAVFLVPEGWVVLSPWVKTVWGDEYRQHCGEFESEKEAVCVCAQLNSYIKEKVKMIEKYVHHGVEVSVQSTLKGKHREHCLCHQNCRFFFPEDPEKNCEIAKANFKVCVDYNLVTPVYECPKYAIETNS